MGVVEIGSGKMNCYLGRCIYEGTSIVVVKCESKLGSRNIGKKKGQSK